MTAKDGNDGNEKEQRTRIITGFLTLYMSSDRTQTMSFEPAVRITRMLLADVIGVPFARCNCDTDMTRLDPVAVRLIDAYNFVVMSIWSICILICIKA